MTWLSKAITRQHLLRDIEETFQTLAKVQMKFNLGKCTFRVEEGQFLGYQITKEGILPNQTKIQEFLDSKIPCNLKGVHEINGWLMALGRFIVKSAKKALLLFQTLKGCIDKKNQFKWTTEADKALQHLKEALH